MPVDQSQLPRATLTVGVRGFEIMKFVNKTLLKLLGIVMPIALRWCERQQRAVLTSGQPLTRVEVEIAKRVGVFHPERIRIKLCEKIPRPTDSILSTLSKLVGYEWSNFAGLTLGYGIYIRKDAFSLELISHEFRHVRQFEQAGSLTAFLTQYITEVLTYGYWNAPLEVEARDEHQPHRELQ